MMKGQRLMRVLWLVAGVAGLSFLGIGFLTDVAAGNHAARIARCVSTLKTSGSQFVPTAEQYRELCVHADAMSHLFGNHVLAQLLFILPVTVLAFITFALTRRTRGVDPDAQPGVGR